MEFWAAKLVQVLTVAGVSTAAHANVELPVIATLLGCDGEHALAHEALAGSKRAYKRRPIFQDDKLFRASASGRIQPTGMRQNARPDTNLHLPWLQPQPGCQEDENMPGFIQRCGDPAQERGSSS